MFRKLKQSCFLMPLTLMACSAAFAETRGEDESATSCRKPELPVLYKASPSEHAETLDIDPTVTVHY